MNVLQAIVLASLIATLTRIEILHYDESRSDRWTRQLVNIVIFLMGWWGAYRFEVTGWLPNWMSVG